MRVSLLSLSLSLSWAVIGGTALARQANLYADAAQGNDQGGANPCTNPAAPCRTITHALTQVPAGVKTSIWLIARPGGIFQDSLETFPLVVPGNAVLQYEGNASTDPFARIRYSGALPAPAEMILFDATTSSLNQGGGIDGEKRGTTAPGIRVESAAPLTGGLVHVRASGPFTNSTVVRRAVIEHAYRGLVIEEVVTSTVGAVLSPSVADCEITWSPAAASVPGSSHVALVGVAPPGGPNPSATFGPQISGSSFQVSGGAFVEAAILINVLVSGTTTPHATVRPSISNCVIDGRDPLNPGLSLFGIGISGGMPGGNPVNGAVDFSPTISGCLVLGCTLQGIRLYAMNQGMSGTPILSATTVRGCGQGVACAASPPPMPTDEGNGNGATIVTGDGAVLTPSVSDCVFEGNQCDGLGLYIRGGGNGTGSASIGGSVVRCVSRENGQDGFELRSRGLALQPAPSITTTFESSRAHDNGDDGMEIVVLDDATAGGPTLASITSLVTNALFFGNGGAGLNVVADNPFGGPAGTLAPTVEWMTCWSNGPVGVAYVPGSAVGSPSLWNCIVGGHATDIAGTVPLTSINYCNYLTGPAGSVGQTMVNPPTFVNVAAGDFHLTTDPGNHCTLIDFGAENPCAVPPCPVPVVPIAVPFDFDGPTNPRVLDNSLALCPPGTPIGDRGVDEVP